MIFPTREGIVGLNRSYIEKTGGTYFPPENLMNANSLEWVLEIIQYPLYYPALAEKAAVLAWTIINSHVFYDGCKRTGMATLVTFLRQNGYDLNAATEEIVDVSVKIAKHAEENYTRQEFVQWVRERLSLTVIEW